MASTNGSRPRARPSHTQGPTWCAYTPDGTRLVTVGSNSTMRIYKTGSDVEPANIDDCPEHNVAVAATDSFIVAGSEDGTVSVYSLETNAFDRYLLRASLPVRDVALSPDAKWCAVATDELTVKLVNVQDNTVLRHLREHGKPTKHLAFDPKGTTLVLSCSDGTIYVYSLTSDQPELIKKVEGVVGALQTEDEASSRVAWHPDGRAFAAPTPIRDVQVVSKSDWKKQRSFRNGHEGDITALAWSPNGALLATAGKDKKVLVWSTKEQTVLATYELANVTDMAWHPTNNLVSLTTSDGDVYIYPNFIPQHYAVLLRLSTQPSPIHDHLAEISGNGRRSEPNGLKAILQQRPRRDSLGSDDSLLDDLNSNDDDFVVDDDGAGYTLNVARKRPHDEDDLFAEHANKRLNLMRPHCHESFQPGSTPWVGNRKYLCLNLVGFVWTVDQDAHHTVTVEFYDHELHRDFHFTDTFLYDKACLNEHGALFACPPREDAPATIFYRPHETWTQRSDWRTQLPKGETVLAMSLSDSFITVTTASYVRIYTLFGIPYRVYRPKSTPVVTCASWRDCVMTVGNGPVGADGNTKLLYSIENVKRDEIFQNEDWVALPEGATIKTAFFSSDGDPCIYDSTGTLLTLLHWRQPGRASWIPLLDTTLLSRLASGRKTESYFPVAVADNKFHCIILKGGDQYPYFPRPLLSEFDFSVPLASAPPPKQQKTKKQRGDEDGDDSMEEDGDDDADEAGEGGGAETRRLEQAFLLAGIQAAQLRDLVEATASTHSQRSTLARLDLERDKTLLQMLAVECREGEDRGMRALEMVRLMRDRSGRMIEAAGKVAERYGRSILGDKIREVGERQLGGMEDDDGDEFA